LKSSDRRGNVKVHGKEGFKQVLGWPIGVLAFPKTNFCFEQRKVHRKWTNRLVKPTFGGGCRIIPVNRIYKGEK